MRSTAEKLDAPDNELKERIIRRAQELRLKWQETEIPDGQADFRGSQKSPEMHVSSTNHKKAANIETSQKPKGLSPRLPQQVLPGIPVEATSEEYRPEAVEEWVIGKGAAALRKLHKWAKESGDFQQSDVSLIYWVAQDIEKKKNPSPSNARKLKRLWEKAVRKGFTKS